MSAPPPGVSPARLRLRERMWTGLFLFLCVVNIGIAIWAMARGGFVSGVTPMILGALCLFAAAKRMWKIHSRFDRRA